MAVDWVDFMLFQGLIFQVPQVFLHFVTRFSCEDVPHHVAKGAFWKSGKTDGKIVSSLRLGCDQLLFNNSRIHFPSFSTFFWGHVLEIYYTYYECVKLCELPLRFMDNQRRSWS